MQAAHHCFMLKLDTVNLKCSYVKIYGEGDVANHSEWYDTVLLIHEINKSTYYFMAMVNIIVIHIPCLVEIRRVKGYKLRIRETALFQYSDTLPSESPTHS